MPSNRLDRALRFVLEGDSKSAQTAFLEFEAAAAKSEKATADMAVKIQADLKAMEEQAKTAAASIAKIGEAGAGGSGGLGGGAVGFTAMGAAMSFAGAEAVRFGEQSVQAFTRSTDAVRLFSQLTGASAEESSKWVNAGQLLGITADTMTNAFGKFGSTIETNGTKLRDHGVELARNQNGSVSLTGTILNLQDAFQKTSDATEKDTIAKLAAGRGYKEFEQILNLTHDQMVQLMDAAGKGPMFNEKDLQDAQNLKIQLNEMQQQIDKVKVAVGKELLGDLTGTVQGVKDIYEWVKKIDDLIPHVSSGFLDVVKGIAESVPVIGPVVGVADTAGRALHEMGNSARDASSALSTIRSSGADGAIADIGKEATITEGKLYSMERAISSARSAWSAFESNANYAANAEDAFTKSLDAFDVASSKAGGAASNLAYDQERGAQRIADAQQRIADAEESSSRRVVDAQTRVKEAREQATQALLSAQQSVEDAKQHLVDEQLAGLRDANPYQAQNRVDVARRGLARAEQRLATTQDSGNESVARAELELQRAQEDRTKTMTKANEALIKTQEEVAHSLERAGGAAGGASQSLGDMKKKVDDLVTATGNHIAAMVLQGQSLGDIATATEQAKAKVDQVGAAWGWPQAQIDAYKGKIDELAGKVVNVTMKLTLDAYQFHIDLQKAAKALADPMSQKYMAVGGEVVGGSGPTYTGADGGIVPGYPGQPVRAIIHGGEQVIPLPHAGAGGGLTVNVYNAGSVISDYDLADHITRVVKQGLVGIRG